MATAPCQRLCKTDDELDHLIPVLEPMQQNSADGLSGQAAHKDALSIMREETANFQIQLEALLFRKNTTLLHPRRPPHAPNLVLNRMCAPQQT